MHSSNLLSVLLENIVKEITITRTMSEKACSSYKAVGKWIGDHTDKTITIFPQGSMAIGTTVKPISDTDEYDIDLVCLLEDGGGLEAEEVKLLVGNSLKESNMYFDKLDKEGKRCWTLQYAEFHMDILPSIPSVTVWEGIQITHTDDFNTYEYKHSNPKGYRKWFLDRIHEASQYKSLQAIEEVPYYDNLSNLQKIVILLKRHRDIMFKDCSDKPSSIIVTTLVAQAYKVKGSLLEETQEVLKALDHNISILSDGKYYLENPAEPNENFLEKWNDDVGKAKNFYNWLKQAREDLLIKLNQLEGLVDLSEYLIDKLQYSKDRGAVTRAVAEVSKAYANARDNNELHANKEGLKIIKKTTRIASVPALATATVKSHHFYGK